jgi:hypothetical protein
MSLIRRTLGCLKPYIGYVTVSSFSAGIHALMAGLFVWLAGPLLMTLFQVSNIEQFPSSTNTDIVAENTVNEQSEEVEGDITEKLEQQLDFI